MFLVFTTGFLRKSDKLRQDVFLDILVSLVLWGLASWLWARTPLAPAFFNPAPRAPNYEFYPHSDAALHDTTAQFLLIGSGFPGIARKPLYALFLAALHSIAGQDYEQVVLLQVMILAALPVLLYWLVKRLHLRVSGVIAALLVIVRETNAIKLAGEIGVSHAKMLMSDLPGTVTVVLVTFLLVIWVQEWSKRRFMPLVIGGCLGALLLLRPQGTVLVPAVFLLVILATWKKPKIWLVNAALVTLGLSLTLLPWLVRSYTLTGQFALNDPSQNAFLTQQYHLQPGTEILRKFSGESQSEFIQRVNQYLVDFVRENPSVVAGFIASHFLHNQIEMLQSLPASFWFVQNPDSDLFPYWRDNWSRMWEECCSVSTYVKRVGYWDPQREPIQRDHLFPLAVSLLGVAFGFGVVWFRRDISGWVPLYVSLVYNFSTSVGRYSGWRLLLPADWVVFLYLAIGLGQGALWLYAFYAGKPVSEVYHPSRETNQPPNGVLAGGSIPSFRRWFLLGMVLLALGLAPVVVEHAVPSRYPAASRSDLAIRAASFLDDESRQFIGGDNVVLTQGRALYPRFYKAGEGEPGDGWEAFSERDFDRLGFILLSGMQRVSVVLPLDEAPGFFPNASDVIVAGCHADGYFRAVFIVLLDETHSTLVRDTRKGLSCSLPTPGTDS
jgi:hypothetical protein